MAFNGRVVGGLKWKDAPEVINAGGNTHRQRGGGQGNSRSHPGFARGGRRGRMAFVIPWRLPSADSKSVVICASLRRRFCGCHIVSV
jgi:hypothetical protein